MKEDGKPYPQLRWHFVWVSVKMLHYERTDVSEGIDFSKTNSSKECMLCYYWFSKKCWI